MAFNFNWSPLTADASFYIRAQELLTTALNKSPKPPIIVDDILVNELNLGSIPPDLEILEIGDLAEDRFRGIFKMCYTGDAFLTLKTRVQVLIWSFLLNRSPAYGPIRQILSIPIYLQSLPSRPHSLLPPPLASPYPSKLPCPRSSSLHSSYWYFHGRKVLPWYSEMIHSNHSRYPLRSTRSRSYENTCRKRSKGSCVLC